MQRTQENVCQAWRIDFLFLFLTWLTSPPLPYTDALQASAATADAAVDAATADAAVDAATADAAVDAATADAAVDAATTNVP